MSKHLPDKETIRDCLLASIFYIIVLIVIVVIVRISLVRFTVYGHWGFASASYRNDIRLHEVKITVIGCKPVEPIDGAAPTLESDASFEFGADVSCPEGRATITGTDNYSVNDDSLVDFTSSNP